MPKKTNIAIRILVIFLLVIVIECCIQLFVKTDDNSNLNENTLNITEEVQNLVAEEKEVIPDTKIKLTAIGDIMCHNTNYMDAYDSSTGQYDFSYVFTDIKEYIESADIAVGNLETTFAGANRKYSSYPEFNTPEALAVDLREMGIDILSTANNHSLDKGYAGIESTIQFLQQAGIDCVGTYTSPESQQKPLIKNVNGINIAFLSFTYGTNGILVPEEKEYCINLIDDRHIVNQINLAKEEDSDLICVFMHWGVEYRLTPTEEQERLADLLFDNGVDIILGGHPHVLEKMEKRTITLEDGTTKDGFLIYSLGNFMSGQVKDNTRSSIILSLEITKNGKNGNITIDNVNYIPIYMYRSSSGKKRYKILDINKVLSEYESGENVITQKQYEMLKAECNEINLIMGEGF